MELELQTVMGSTWYETVIMLQALKLTDKKVILKDEFIISSLMTLLK